VPVRLEGIFLYEAVIETGQLEGMARGSTSAARPMAAVVVDDVSVGVEVSVGDKVSIGLVEPHLIRSFQQLRRAGET